MASGQRIARLAARAAQSSSPLDALRTAGELRRELDGFERQQVARALAQGMTFAQIARHLGLSRQAVHRRFRSVTEEEAPLSTTSDVRELLGVAREEAAELGGSRPQSEHIVLAALRASDLPAAAVLRTAGATLEQARRLLDAASHRAPTFRHDDTAGGLRTVLAAAAGEARRRRDREIVVEHLLIGALDDGDGGAARLLRALDVDVDAVRGELRALLGAPSRNSDQPVD